VYKERAFRAEKNIFPILPSYQPKSKIRNPFAEKGIDYRELSSLLRSINTHTTFIMPHLPFTPTSSASSSPKTSPSPPSIVLSPASGILDRSG
jgi:ABC-type microcin C transport system permease subunit YejE